MPLKHPSLVLGGIVLCQLAWACGGDPAGGQPPAPETDVCPTIPGEFLPTDCAIVRGVARNAQGQALGGSAIRVDSATPQVYHYASNSALTAADGRFSLTILRIYRLTPPTNPDTATVEIKSYPGTDPRPHDVPDGRAAIRMNFAELDRAVKATLGDAVFLKY